MVRTIALIGAGDVAKFFVEEMLAAGHKTIILSRAIRPWFDRPDVTLLISDYSADSFRAIFDEYSVEAVFCFIHDNTYFYNAVHENILKACTASKTAKRFVPSEYDGDIDMHWDKPRSRLDTHVPFRKVLASQTAIEYTLLNPGWFMDYIVPADRTYMKNLYPLWPVDINGECDTVVIPGTGEESIGFTSARDVARCAVHLLELSKWPEKTYVCGEYTTWNKLVEQLGRFYGREFKITYKPTSEVERVMNDPTSSRESRDFVYIEEWSYSGASAPPRELLLSGVHLRSIQDLLDDGQRGGAV